MMYKLCVSYFILMVVAENKQLNNDYNFNSKIGNPAQYPISKHGFEKFTRINLDNSKRDLNSARKFRRQELRQVPSLNYPDEDKYVLITEKYKGLIPYGGAIQQIGPLISPQYTPSGVQKIYVNNNRDLFGSMGPTEKIHRVLFKQNGQQNQQNQQIRPCLQREAPNAQDSDSAQSEATLLYVPQYGQYKYRSVQPYYNGKIDRYGPVKLGSGSGPPVFYFVGDPSRKYVLPNNMMYRNDRNEFDKTAISDSSGENLKVNPQDGYYFIVPIGNKQLLVPSANDAKLKPMLKFDQLQNQDDIYNPNSSPKTNCDNGQQIQNANRNSKKRSNNEDFIPVMKYNSKHHTLNSKSNLNGENFYNPAVRKSALSKRKTSSKRGFMSNVIDFFKRPFKKKDQLPTENSATKIVPEKEVTITNRPYNKNVFHKLKRIRQQKIRNGNRIEGTRKLK